MRQINSRDAARFPLATVRATQQSRAAINRVLSKGCMKVDPMASIARFPELEAEIFQVPFDFVKISSVYRRPRLFEGAIPRILFVHAFFSVVAVPNRIIVVSSE